MTQLKQAEAFLVPKLRPVAHFLSRQGIAMGGNLLYGLLCVRILPVPDYAKFAVLFGYMSSITALLDIGSSYTLAPLVGEQVNNLQLIADYVASLRRIALRLYVVVAPVAAVTFVFLVQKQHWGALAVGQMIAVLLVTAWFARVGSAYGAVMLLRRDRNRYYRHQIIGSLSSLTLLLIFWVFHRLNVYVGILLNVGQVIFTATNNFRRARQLLGVKGKASARQERGILRLVLPNVPNIVFNAIQGQITLMLITFFGHSTASVASIGALARLGQIMAFFSQMNSVLFEPFYAKLPMLRLKRMYLLGLAMAGACAATMFGLALIFPELFLAILGPKYSQLRVEVRLVILSSSIYYLGGFVFMMNSSRRFVYWWNNLTNIVVILLVQTVFVWRIDLSTMRNVLILNTATVTAALAVAVACGVYGFWRGPQKIENVIPEENSLSGV